MQRPSMVRSTTFAALAAATTAFALAGCDKSRDNPPSTSAVAVTPPATTSPVTIGVTANVLTATEYQVLRQAVLGTLSRQRFLNHAPDSTLDNSYESVCSNPGDDEGITFNGIWGIARPKVVELTVSTSAAIATVEVVRVVNVELDSTMLSERDRGGKSTDMVVVAPVVDTVELWMRRSPDGRWLQCLPVEDNAQGASNPIHLAGAASDSFSTFGRPITLTVPAGATVAYARAVADSIERAASATPSPDSLATPGASAAVPTATDYAALREDIVNFLSRHRYQHFAPDSSDDWRRQASCRDSSESREVSPSVSWGYARAKLLRLRLLDSTSAIAGAEVVRVLSIEGDLTAKPMFGPDGAADMVTVAPVFDTLELQLRRRPDRRWAPCAPVRRPWYRGAIEAIALIGPVADTLRPRGRPIVRMMPTGATWSKVRALADSVERAASP